MRHEPLLLTSRQLGAWCECACGLWRSGRYTTVTGAHYAFGLHLLETAR